VIETLLYPKPGRLLFGMKRGPILTFQAKWLINVFIGSVDGRFDIRHLLRNCKKGHIVYVDFVMIFLSVINVILLLLRYHILMLGLILYMIGLG
jgi:hypothetical protein